MAKALARIEEQKQTALTNIQTNKETTLKQLDIEYANWDKAKTSFGYIGITFLTVLFGTIFGNDLIKVFIHYLSHLRGWWRQRRRNINIQREQREREEVDQEQVQIELDQEYADNLEESLERVYLRLVQANANNR